MKHIISLCLLLIIVQYSTAQVVINELDCDNPSVDTKEFIELKSTTPNFPLDGYVLVLFNGGNSDLSYFAQDLDGFVTDNNGLFVIGGSDVVPFPQLLIQNNTIQNGADAAAIYQANASDFPTGTTATQVNLIDALVYDTSDADDTSLLTLLGETNQINEGSSGNTNSIQLNNDGTSYMVASPTPRALNSGGGYAYNPVAIQTNQENYTEGETLIITFTTQTNVTDQVTFSFELSNGGFDTSDYTGSTTVTIPAGQNTATATITIVDDTLDEGDEELKIKFSNLQDPLIANNNDVVVRVVDNDFTIANYGTPLNPTFGNVTSTQPSGYYDSLDGLSGADLEQALQDIIADETTVRAQTYAEIVDILKEADVNPLNSNQVWLVYTEQGRSKLDYQTTSSSLGKWNREHTFPRSRGGFFSIDEDDAVNGKEIYWPTHADSLRHGNSDAHALRAVDGPENSSRGNQFYGQYTGPSDTAGSFKGDVARSILYMQIRYNALSVVNGYPSVTGQFGDLETLLDWHRNDPPDDYEMHRNNVVYTWQINRNPFIDQPDLVEYIWGNHEGEVWNAALGVNSFNNTDIKLFPNPVSNMLFVSGINKAYDISIFSSEGRLVLSKSNIKKNAIALNLASGLYLVKMVSENNTFTRKLIVR